MQAPSSFHPSLVCIRSLCTALSPVSPNFSPNTAKRSRYGPAPATHARNQGRAQFSATESEYCPWSLNLHHFSLNLPTPKVVSAENHSWEMTPLSASRLGCILPLIQWSWCSHLGLWRLASCIQRGLPLSDNWKRTSFPSSRFHVSFRSLSAHLAIWFHLGSLKRNSEPLFVF